MGTSNPRSLTFRSSGTHNRSPSALHALSGADSRSPVLEKNMHSSLGLDRAAGNGSYGFFGQKSEQPTHHLISDTDLQSLLSVALSSSTDDEDIEGQLAARPSEVLLDFEKRLLDSSENDLGPKRSRLRALSRVVKRIYGIRLHGHGKDKGVRIPIDPESLVPITVDLSDCDDFKKSPDV